MKFQSSVDRIVGKVTDEEKKLIAREMEKRFLTQYATRNLVERQKSAEDLQMIELADSETSKVLRHYDENPFSIPSGNIHFIDSDKWNLREGTAGITRPQYQSILLRDDRSRSILYAHIFHEMLHFKSHYAVQVPTEEGLEPLEDYRLGLSVHSRNIKKEYFHNLNEAVTEELTKRYVLTAFNGPMFAKERDQFVAFRSAQNLKGNDVYALRVELDPEQPAERTRKGLQRYLVKTKEFEYKEERAILKALCDNVACANPQKFSSSDEVLDLFAKAMFSGNILPLGRTIDGSFGKGTFRRIGAAGNDNDRLRRIVLSL